MCPVGQKFFVVLTRKIQSWWSGLLRNKNKNCSSSILIFNAKETRSTRDVAVFVPADGVCRLRTLMLFSSVYSCLLDVHFQNINFTKGV